MLAAAGGRTGAIFELAPDGGRVITSTTHVDALRLHDLTAAVMTSRSTGIEVMLALQLRVIASGCEANGIYARCRDMVASLRSQ